MASPVAASNFCVAANSCPLSSPPRTGSFPECRKGLITTDQKLELGSQLPQDIGRLQNFGQVALVASVAAALMFADPALAFKGGGPYGQEVTRGLDLSGRDFSGQTLIKQDFKASNLRQVNFKGAKLLGASFFDANLTGADLTDADLRGADFSLTNAAKANFTNANLEGALVTGNTSFKGATITGADFTDVLFRDDQHSYLCSIADGVNSVTGNATKDTIGC